MSQEFNPSVGAAKKAVPHVAVEQRDYPAGVKGIEISLNEVAARIKKGRNDPRVRSWAIRTLKAAGEPQGIVPQTQALLNGLRKATMYVQDPINTEFMQAAHETLCLDDKGYCFKGGDCFPKGTLLLRDDYELVPIEQIEVGDRIWGYDKWTTVEATKYKGLLNVDAVFCNNGSVVQLTSDHKVYVLRCEKHETHSTPCACDPAERRIDRVNVSELRKDDVLATPKRIDFGTVAFDPDRAYIEGLYVSDGWCEEYRFSISGQDGEPKEEQKKEVKAICDRLGIDTYMHRKHIRVLDSEWTLRMQQMGLYAPEKHLLSINLDEAAAAPTLRGVMADSGKNTHGSGRTFTSTSKKLTTQTRVLHKMFGLSCSIRYIEDHGGLGENPIWRLGVRVRDRADGKREKLLRVKAVEQQVRKAPCYDIQTSDHYVYLPEHDVTVSNCDDLSIALGSATLSVGIPTYVVGQAFGGAKVPTHVLIAVEDKMGTKHRVDPSSKFDVGGYFPASNEVWLNPFEDKANLSGTSGTSDFVGVGATPISDATYAALSTQLQAVVKTLGNSLITLDSSLTQISATRKILRPNIPFDPEPTSFSIKSLADFPTGGVWTKSMDVISRQLYSIGRTVLDACQQALDGARTVYIDEKTLDAYIEAKERDDWRFQVVWEGAKDAIIGMFNPIGELFAGFTTVLGAYLSAQEIKAQQSGQNQTGVQGPPDDATGLGVIQFEVIAGLAVAAVCTVAVAYAISKLCDRGASEAKEATNQSVLQFVTDCVQSGKCTAEQAKEILNAQAVMRKAEADADAAKAKHDPFQGTLDALGGVLKWVAIGGAVVGGIYFLGPLVRDAGEEAIAHHRLKKAPG